MEMDLRILLTKLLRKVPEGLVPTFRGDFFTMQSIFDSARIAQKRRRPERTLPVDQIFSDAISQALGGKGSERHSTEVGDESPRGWTEQPLQWIQEAVGPGFAIGQAMKKVHESAILPPGKDYAEVLGAMVYLAGAIHYLSQDRPAGKPARMLPAGPCLNDLNRRMLLEDLAEILRSPNADNRLRKANVAMIGLAGMAQTLHHRDHPPKRTWTPVAPDPQEAKRLREEWSNLLRWQAEERDREAAERGEADRASQRDHEAAHADDLGDLLRSPGKK